MNRRDFLRAVAVGAGMAMMPRPFAAQGMEGNPDGDGVFAPAPGSGWRTFELTTRVEPVRRDGAIHVWVPLPSLPDSDWQLSLGDRWNGNASVMRRVRAPGGADMLYARWAPDLDGPLLEVVSRVRTRDRTTEFARPLEVAPTLSGEQRVHYTRGTRLLPTDGIVREAALEIVPGAARDEEKARAIYEWIVDNTFREPSVRGCGTGDIRAMLETGNLSGKCADLNSLFVGLARAAGLPARDLYGLRIADSRFGYGSLGKSGNVSSAQHCRAEVFLERHGWVPVDPADVRKVILEEAPGNLPMDHAKVRAVREQLFGGWEMNWLAYNDAHDLDLPGSQGPKIPFLMYPQGEDASGRFYSLDPAAFIYELTARETG